MLQNVLSWAVENDVKINFQKVDAGIIMVVRKDDIYTAFCLKDTTGKIDPICHDFLQHFMLPAIDAVRLEHTKHPKPQEQP